MQQVREHQISDIMFVNDPELGFGILNGII